MKLRTFAPGNTHSTNALQRFCRPPIWPPLLQAQEGSYDPPDSKRVQMGQLCKMYTRLRLSCAHLPAASDDPHPPPTAACSSASSAISAPPLPPPAASVLFASFPGSI